MKLRSANKHKPLGCGVCSQRHPHVDQYIFDCLQDTSVHGVKYFSSAKLNIFERVFWLIAFLACVGFGIYMVSNTLDRYFRSPIIISFEPTETPVSRIPFPGITICNVNLLKRSVLTKVYENVLAELKDYGDRVHEAQTHLDVPTSIIDGVILVDHLTQFCLSAQSFRRRIRQQLFDASGKPDFMNVLQENLTHIDANFSHLLYGERRHRLTPETRQIYREATMKCEDLILSCLWAGAPIPCKDYFFRINTRSGHCCAFNMMPRFILFQNASLAEHRTRMEKEHFPKRAEEGWKEFIRKGVLVDKSTTRNDSDYPKYQTAGGKPYGLSILLNPNLKEYSTCTVNDGAGFKLVAHSPVSLPSIMEYSSAIPVNSEIFINIEPQVSLYDWGKLSTTEIGKRGCYIHTDPDMKLKHFKFYTAENCITECIAEHTQRNCSCVAHFMPRNASQQTCGANKRVCVDDVRLIVATTVGKKAYCPKCRPPCMDIKYRMEMSQFPLHQGRDSMYFNNSKGVKQKTSNYSIVHLYFGTDSIYSKERKPIFDWKDLASNAGGLLGLAFGMSIPSLVELAYFLTLRAWFQFQAYRKARDGEVDDAANEDDRLSYRGRNANWKWIM